MANLLETLGPSPLTFSYGNWVWVWVVFDTYHASNSVPGDVYEGVITGLPPHIFIAQTASNGSHYVPVPGQQPVNSGAFSFPVVSTGGDIYLGLVEAVDYGNGPEYYGGNIYGPLDFTITYDTPPPPIFWTGFIGTKETQG